MYICRNWKREGEEKRKKKCYIRLSRRDPCLVFGRTNAKIPSLAIQTHLKQPRYKSSPTLLACHNSISDKDTSRQNAVHICLQPDPPYGRRAHCPFVHSADCTGTDCLQRRHSDAGRINGLRNVLHKTTPLKNPFSLFNTNPF